MDSPEYIQSIIQAAILYYNDNMTQVEIARRLGVTRQTVSKLLNEARCRKIVEITINNPLKTVQELSDNLINTFGLKNAIVVPGNYADEEMGRSIISHKAAEYVNTLLGGGISRIGIAWGRTVQAFIKNFTDSDNNRVKGPEVVPLIGASNRTAPYFMINEMVRELSVKISGSPYFIYVPFNPESDEEYKLFKKTKVFRDISELWENIDLAIVGIGAATLEHFLYSYVYRMDGSIADPSKSANVTGDVCTHYFDHFGTIIRSKEISRLIRISEDNLRKSKRVLAISSGVKKAPAIAGALRTGIITDIVLDENAAKEVVKMGMS